MISFLIISWFTVLVAVIPAGYEGIEAWRNRNGSSTSPDVVDARTSRSNIWRTQIRPHPSNRSSPGSALQVQEAKQPRLVSQFTKMLEPLCDLQAVTGLAIMVGGFAKWHVITYYHEELVYSYWELTLNSFWVARIQWMDHDASKGDPPVRLLLRRATILASCLLSVVWQLRILRREDPEYGGSWDDYPGPGDDARADWLCYRYRDGTALLPWTVGEVLFSIALSFSLFDRTWKINEKYVQVTEGIQKKLITWLRKYVARLTGSLDDFTLTPTRVAVTIFHILLVALLGFFIALYWISSQWVAVWSYGDGFYPVLWFIYIGFNAWTTFDILSLYTMNWVLLPAEEHAWGFGQVLPIIMILSVVYNVMDIFRPESNMN